MVRVVVIALLGAAGLIAAAPPGHAQLVLTPQMRQTPTQPVSPQRRPQAERPPGQSAQPTRPGERRQGQRRGARAGAAAAGGAAAGAAAGAAGAEAATNSSFARRLEPRAIRERFFDGQPFNVRAIGGQIFRMTFHPDGRIERTDTQGQTVNGRWRFLGDTYCSRWDGNPAESCHTVVEEASVVRVVRNTRAVAVWARGDLPPP